MKNKIKSNVSSSLYGLLIGIFNGLLGAGGGIVAVEVLKKYGLDQKRAQTTSIAIIFPLCILSAFLYSTKSDVDLKIALILIPAGVAGALLGTFLMKKMSLKLVKKIFCIVLIYAGARMIFGG